MPVKVSHIFMPSYIPYCKLCIFMFQLLKIKTAFVLAQLILYLVGVYCKVSVPNFLNRIVVFPTSSFFEFLNLSNLVPIVLLYSSS